MKAADVYTKHCRDMFQQGKCLLFQLIQLGEKIFYAIM